MEKHAATGMFAILIVTAWHAGAEPRIESFSPTGYAKDVSQVAVRFSEPMVALGDTRMANPFVVECDVPGNGRWIDAHNWVYDFAYDVPSAERCRFNLRRRVRTLAGQRLTGARQYVLHTGGPNIIDGPIGNTRMWQRRIDERQVFLVALDADADEDSIRRHVHCRVRGVSRRVAVDVVTGAERDEIIGALSARAYPGTIDRLVESASTHLPRDDAGALRDRALRRIAAVRCTEPLPGGADVALVWGAGVASVEGAVKAQDDVYDFSVRPAFAANVHCSVRFDARCLGSIRLEFSAPVEREVAKRIRLFDADGAEVPTVVADSPQVDRVETEGIVAEESTYRVELAPGRAGTSPGATGPFVDIDGRGLANHDDYPLVVQTGTPPMSGTFGHGTIVVPPGGDAAAPGVFYRPPQTLRGRRLAVANDEDLSRWLREFEDIREGRRSYWGDYDSPPLGEDGPGTPFELAFNERDGAFQTAAVPLTGQGLQILEVALPPAESIPKTRYVIGKAIATGLDVHFKLGRESSLVWVTGFTDGRPLADAALRITDGCTGALLWHGRSDADGLARVALALPAVDGCSRPHYLVSARKDADHGFVAIPHEQWPGQKGNRSLKGHSIFDRALLQPGDTVSMKHVLRLATSNGFALPDPSMRSVRVSIRHLTLGEVHTEAIVLDASGIATSTFEVPDDAFLGAYDVILRTAETDVKSGEFRVERFRVASVRAQITTPLEPIVAPSSIPLDLDIEHLAGGGAANLPVTVRTTFHRWDADAFEDETELPREQTRTTRETLDGTGKARLVVRDLPEFRDFVSLQVEMDYRDHNGQMKTASKWFEIWPAAIRLEIVGGHTATMHTGTRESATSPPAAHIRAYDAADSPVAGIAVEADFVLRANHWLDERLPGGFRASYRASSRTGGRLLLGNHPRRRHRGLSNPRPPSRTRRISTPPASRNRTRRPGKRHAGVSPRSGEPIGRHP